MATSAGTNTFTADNGSSVQVRFAGQFVDENEPIVDETAGTITFSSTNKGLPELIKTTNGSVLLRGAGIITFANTFDLVTGDFVASEITVNKGPHPEADRMARRLPDHVRHGSRRRGRYQRVLAHGHRAPSHARVTPDRSGHRRCACATGPASGSPETEVAPPSTRVSPGS